MKENLIIKNKKRIYICIITGIIFFLIVGISVFFTREQGNENNDTRCVKAENAIKVANKEKPKNKEKVEKTVHENKSSNKTEETISYVSASPYQYSASTTDVAKPSESTFGQYHNYAMQIYNFIVNGTSLEEFVFNSRADFDDFNSKVNSEIFASCSIPELQSIMYAYVSTSGSRIIAKPMCTGHNIYAEQKAFENLIISICGYQTTDKALIDNLNSWLMNNTSYDYSYSQLSYDYNGIVYNRKAVCNGFSRFIKKACDMYGVPCQISLGTVDTGDHAWNRVQIGGTWYYIDTTWNVCYQNDSYYLSQSLWSDHYL